MFLSRKAEILYTGLSFLAAFLFTQGIFERLCDREDFSEEKTELLWELRKIDSVEISRDRPRDEFEFTTEPWKVVRRISNNFFVCPHTSKKDPIKVVVFIKSAANYSTRREAVRETWGKVSHLENMVVHIVFIVGMTTPDVQRTIDAESSYYGDMLQYIGVDDYRHITYKVLAGMQWAKYNLPRDYFYATADDDLLVNLTDLPKQLRLHMKRAKGSLPTASPKTLQTQLSKMPIICLLSYREREPPVRNIHSDYAKYFLDRREYPMSFLPTFCLGGFYMMPVERVSKLYDSSRTERALPMDDVWITGMLRLKIKPNHVDAIDSSAEGRKSHYVTHLMGDRDLDIVVSEHVLARWSKIWLDLKKKKYCLRDEFSFI